MSKDVCNNLLIFCVQNGVSTKTGTKIEKDGHTHKEKQKSGSTAEVPNNEVNDLFIKERK